MTAQEFFYIVGSVAAILFVLLAVMFAVITVVVTRKVNRTLARSQAIIAEIHGILQSARSYSRYVGASAVARLFGVLLRVFRKRSRY